LKNFPLSKKLNRRGHGCGHLGKYPRDAVRATGVLQVEDCNVPIVSRTLD
jgi:hypothetical protein